MKKKSKVYLICGKTGAGKTTIAKLLEKELSAFRVSHNEWLLLTYGDNIPEDEFQECCKRISFTNMEKIDEEFAKDEKCIIFKNENGKINIKTLTCQCT